MIISTYKLTSIFPGHECREECESHKETPEEYLEQQTCQHQHDVTCENKGVGHVFMKSTNHFVLFMNTTNYIALYLWTWLIIHHCLLVYTANHISQYSITYLCKACQCGMLYFLDYFYPRNLLRKTLTTTLHFVYLIIKYTSKC